MQGTVLDAESVEVTILLVSYLHEISLLNNGTLARMRTGMPKVSNLRDSKEDMVNIKRYFVFPLELTHF